MAALKQPLRVHIAAQDHDIGQQVEQILGASQLAHFEVLYNGTSEEYDVEIINFQTALKIGHADLINNRKHPIIMLSTTEQYHDALKVTDRLNLDALVCTEGESSLALTIYNLNRLYFNTRKLTDHEQELKYLRSLIVQRDIGDQHKSIETIVHDTNNMLTIAIGNLDLFLCLNSDYQNNEHLLAALGSLSQIDQIMRASRGEAIISKVNVTDNISEVVNLFSLSHPNITFDVDYRGGEELYVSMADVHLKQILTNITTNAVQAMQGEGKIAYKAKVLSDEWISFEIEDSGCGMSEEMCAQAFEIGKSTKEKHQGLGLYCVKNIIGKYGGQIQCSSEPGKYTRFSLKLPMYQDYKEK